MSENKFTPGPWLQADGDKTFIYALNDKGYNRFWFKLQSNTHIECEASQEELEANSDLIAAAPELLEALEDAIEQIYDNPILERKIEKAIAKAKGE